MSLYSERHGSDWGDVDLVSNITRGCQRVPTYQITMSDSGMEFPCADTTSVLEASERGKFSDPSLVSSPGKRPIFVGCRRGGCGACKIEVLDGTYEKRKMSRSYVSADEEERGVVMSCRIYPTSDMVVRFVGLDRPKRTIILPVGNQQPAGPDLT